MRPERLRIGGLVPFSTVDFPGRLSAVVFCQGCAWRCRYCHNAHLQSFCGGMVPWREVWDHLMDRQGLLDAVVFSGGEPTAQPALEDAILSARSLGYEIGLHTAGIHPDRLARVLPLVDWVGLDVKAPFDARHDAITQVPGSWRVAQTSLEHVLEEGVAYELRTTVHPALLDERARDDIRRQLRKLGATDTNWQRFRPDGCCDAGLLGAEEA